MAEQDSPKENENRKKDSLCASLSFPLYLLSNSNNYASGECAKGENCKHEEKCTETELEMMINDMIE
jgi:hypothetical protein